MDAAHDLEALAKRVEAAAGPDRDLDADIAEFAYGWKPCRIPADFNGENACEVLTRDGAPYTCNGQRWNYPPKGAVHRAYHCEHYTRDATDPVIPRDYVRQQTAASLRALSQGVNDDHA